MGLASLRVSREPAFLGGPANERPLGHFLFMAWGEFPVCGEGESPACGGGGGSLRCSARIFSSSPFDENRTSLFFFVASYPLLRRESLPYLDVSCSVQLMLLSNESLSIVVRADLWFQTLAVCVGLGATGGGVVSCTIGVVSGTMVSSTVGVVT